MLKKSDLSLHDSYFQCILVPWSTAGVAAATAAVYPARILRPTLNPLGRISYWGRERWQGSYRMFASRLERIFRRHDVLYMLWIEMEIFSFFFVLYSQSQKETRFFSKATQIYLNLPYPKQDLGKSCYRSQRLSTEHRSCCLCFWDYQKDSNLFMPTFLLLRHVFSDVSGDMRHFSPFYPSTHSSGNLSLTLSALQSTLFVWYFHISSTQHPRLCIFFLFVRRDSVFSRVLWYINAILH